MRERTRLNAALLARLPKLRFIGSNEPMNAAIELDAATQDTYGVFYGETVENLLAWMDGAPIRTM